MKAIDINCFFRCALKGDTASALRHAPRIIEEARRTGEPELANMLQSTLDNHLAFVGGAVTLDGAPHALEVLINGPIIKDPKWASVDTQ